MENKLFWVNLIFVGLIALVAWLFPSPGVSDFRLKTLGMFLQLIGVLTVWRDLSGTTHTFQKMGILRGTWDWLRIGFGAKRPIPLSSNLSSKSTVNADLEVSYRIDAEMPDSERIKMLQKEIDGLRDDQRQMRHRQKADVEDLKKLISQESEKGAEANKVLAERLEVVSAGNASLLLFGLGWLAVGIVLSTWAPEISKMVGGSWPDVLTAV